MLWLISPVSMVLLWAESETSADSFPPGRIHSRSQVQVRLTQLSPLERERDLSETECSHRKRRGWDLVCESEKNRPVGFKMCLSAELEKATGELQKPQNL